MFYVNNSRWRISKRPLIYFLSKFRSYLPQKPTQLRRNEPRKEANVRRKKPARKKGKKEEKERKRKQKEDRKRHQSSQRPMDRRSLRCPARWWSTSVFWKARQQRSGDEPRERPQEKRGEARGEKRGASDVWISSRESPWLLECGPLGSRYIQVAQCRGSSSVYMYIYIYINIYPIYWIIYTYTTAQKFLNRSFDKREFFPTFFLVEKYWTFDVFLRTWCVGTITRVTCDVTLWPFP